MKRTAAARNRVAYDRWEVIVQLGLVVVDKSAGVSQTGGNCLLGSELRVYLDFNSF